MHSLIRLGIAVSLAACSGQEQPAEGSGASTADDIGSADDASGSAATSSLAAPSTVNRQSASDATSGPSVVLPDANSRSSDETQDPNSIGPTSGDSNSQVSPNEASSGAATTSPDDSGLPQPFPNGSPTETDLTALPTVRQEHAVVALGDEIYVLGGFTPSATSTVQAYAPATDTWRDIADFPVAFHHPNAGAVDGKLYVAGFLLGSSLSDGDGRVFVYEPAADEWTQRASMPAGTDRGSACVTTLGSKLYVFGGASNTTVPDASAYDTAADTWEDLTFMPELREHCVAAAVSGLIYIVSGRAGSISGIGAESFVYDPATDTYAERAPIPTPRGGTAGTLLHGRIFVFGGEGNPASESGVFSEVEAYDPATDTWHTYPSMTIPRHGFGAATLGERIYLPGGGTAQGFGSVDAHTVFTFAP